MLTNHHTVLPHATHRHPTATVTQYTPHIMTAIQSALFGSASESLTTTDVSNLLEVCSLLIHSPTLQPAEQLTHMCGMVNPIVASVRELLESGECVFAVVPCDVVTAQALHPHMCGRGFVMLHTHAHVRAKACLLHTQGRSVCALQTN